MPLPRAATALLSLCFIWAGAANPLCAWWDGGHKAVAILAFQRLTPEQRAWVMTQLEAHPTKEELFEGPLKEELGATPDPETRAKWYFAQASIWSDLVRKYDGYPNAKEINTKYHHSVWHYTDLPIFPDQKARRELKAKDVEPPMDWRPGMKEPEHGFNSMHTLERVIHELGDPAVSPADKAVDLCWLFHLVGDTHQPCHCAELYVPEKLEDGDRGANRILILGIKSANPELTADVLHYFWDSLWNGEKNGVAEVESRLNVIKADGGLWTRATAAAKVTEPQAWLREGHALAVSHVYSPELLQRLSVTKPQKNPGQGRPEDVMMITMTKPVMDNYVAKARLVSREQVAIAGFRLAEVLKRVAR